MTSVPDYGARATDRDREGREIIEFLNFHSVTPMWAQALPGSAGPSSRRRHRFLSGAPTNLSSDGR
jgi:hypothetical protein